MVSPVPGAFLRRAGAAGEFGGAGTGLLPADEAADLVPQVVAQAVRLPQAQVAPLAPASPPAPPPPGGPLKASRCPPRAHQGGEDLRQDPRLAHRPGGGQVEDLPVCGRRRFRSARTPPAPAPGAAPGPGPSPPPGRICAPRCPAGSPPGPGGRGPRRGPAGPLRCPRRSPVPPGGAGRGRRRSPTTWSSQRIPSSVGPVRRARVLAVARRATKWRTSVSWRRSRSRDAVRSSSMEGLLWVR